MTTTRRLPFWFIGKATIAAVLFVIRGLHVAAEIGAVDLDRAGNGFAVLLGGERFADLVGHDESRLVLAIEVAAELQGAMALGAVDEDRDCQEIVADGEFAAGEDRPGRDAELMLARLALEDRAGLVAVDRRGSRSAGKPARRRSSPADQRKARGLPRRSCAQPRQRERAGGGGEKEVLRHIVSPTFSVDLGDKR